jgi:hypothetical protein
MNSKLKQLVLLGLMLPALALADEVAQVLSSVELKKEPYSDASNGAKLPAQALVNVLKRQGAWVNVKPATGEQGWLKMSAIKLTDGKTNVDGKKSNNDLGTLFDLGKKSRSASNGVAVTTGIRGMSEEELRNASPNPAAVSKMDSFAASSSDGQSFASQKQLKNQRIDYLKP